MSANLRLGKIGTLSAKLNNELLLTTCSMCQLSSKLKFCSCSKVDFDTVENYWVFHRWQRKKVEEQMLVMGETLLPLALPAETEALNEKTLLRILNEEAPFDVDLKPKQHDRLSLHFTLPAGCVAYGFQYYRYKWVPEEWGPFSWQWQHKEEAEGEIINSFECL